MRGSGGGGVRRGVDESLQTREMMSDEIRDRTPRERQRGEGPQTRDEDARRILELTHNRQKSTMEAAATAVVEDGLVAATALKGTRTIKACRVTGRHENHGMDASETRRLNGGYM